MQKKGAIELSIGTIVIVVLAMTMLILGIILVQNIFSGATDITDMTNDQLKNQVSQLFGEDEKLVVYPDTKHVYITAGEVTGFGIGIKNLLSGASASTEFSYEVIVSDEDIREKCGVTAEQAEGWITTGRAEKLPIAPGEFSSGRVLLEIPEGTSLCTFRYRVNVMVDGSAYASELMDVTIEA